MPKFWWRLKSFAIDCHFSTMSNEIAWRFVDLGTKKRGVQIRNTNLVDSYLHEVRTMI